MDDCNEFVCKVPFHVRYIKVDKLPVAFCQHEGQHDIGHRVFDMYLIQICLFSILRLSVSGSLSAYNNFMFTRKSSQYHLNQFSR